MSARPVLLWLPTNIIMPEKIDSLTRSGFDKPHVDVNNKLKEQDVSQVLFQLLRHCTCSWNQCAVPGAGRISVIASAKAVFFRVPGTSLGPALMESQCWSPERSFTSFRNAWQEGGQVKLLNVCHSYNCCTVCSLGILALANIWSWCHIIMSFKLCFKYVRCFLN